MPTENTSATDSGAIQALRMVEDFLDASMVPDPVLARTFLASDVKITFTGGRQLTSAAEVALFNAQRYKRVSKKFERTDVLAGSAPDEFTVYNSGTLFGEWPDGEAFSGNRYVDRFTVRRGKIVRMEVWNDSAELLLVRAGLVKE